MIMKNSLLVLMISLTVISCNKKSKSDTVISGTSAYVGKTYTLCTNDSLTSTLEEIQFLDAENFSWKYTNYSDIDCLGKDKQVTDNFTGKYRYSASTGIYGELLLKAEMTFHDQILMDTIIADNTQNCGFTDWVIDVAKDITGSLSCYGGTFEPYSEYDEVSGATLAADVVTINGISYYP